jgi:hypothetical protein
MPQLSHSTRLHVQLLRGNTLLWQGRWPCTGADDQFGTLVEHRLSERGHWVDLAPYCQDVALEGVSEARYEHRLVNVVEKFGTAVELEDTLTVRVQREP